MIEPDRISRAATVGAVSAVGFGTRVLSGIISEGINRFAALIDAAAGENISTVSTSANVEAAGQIRCLQIVRGTFPSQLPLPPTALVAVGRQPPAWATELGLDEAKFDALVSNGLAPSGQPDFVFEAYFRQPTSLQVHALAPTFVAFYSPIERRLLRFGTERDIILNVVFYGLDKKVDSPNAPTATIRIGKVSAGVSYFWPPPNNDKATPGESPWFALPVVPFTATATILETEEASQIAKIASAIATPLLPDLKVQIEEQTLIEMREQANARRSKADADLSAAFNTALSTAMTALKNCAPSDPSAPRDGDKGGTPDLALLAANSVLAANAAAVQARRAPPFPETVRLSIDDATNWNSCWTARQAFFDGPPGARRPIGSVNR